MEQNKKIVIFAPEFHEPAIEGIQKNALSMAGSFAQMGFGVQVYTYLSFGEKGKPEQGIDVSYAINFKKNKIARYFSWLFNAAKIYREIKAIKPQRIVFFSLDRPLMIPLFILSFGRFPITLSIFSYRELGGPAGLLLKIVKNKITTFIVQSEYMKGALEWAEVSSNKISVLAFLPEKEKFYPPEKISEKIPAFGYLSNATHAGGVYDVVAAAKSVPGANFVLAMRKFSEKEEVDVKMLFEAMKKEKVSNVTVERNIRNVAEFIREIRCVIMPPKDQNNTMSFPMVMSESFLSKTLVICSNLPVFGYFKKNDFVVSYDSQEELVEIVAKIAKEGIGMYSNRVEDAYRWAKNMPDPTAAAKIYLS